MKYLLVSVCITAAFGAQAWNVTTDPTIKNALVEEYTGMHCQNCPDGHRIVAALSTLHPENVFTVAIHAGGFATPRRGEPNFITETGQAIHDHYGIESYPCGIVNRRAYGNNLVLSRSDWGGACRQANRETAPVNLWANSAYDAASGQLTLDVEGYYTADIANPRLNVFLLQSEILGPQDGGELGVEYPHRHMFRDRLTDNDLGDAIDVKSAGEYFSRSFTYTLPAAIGDGPTDPVNTRLLVFVTDGDDDVCQVIESHPATPGVEPKFSVSTSVSPISITKNYALGYVEVYINNHGGVDITSADFDITLNGNVVSTPWTGLVPAYTNQLVRVNVGSDWTDAIDSDSNQFAIRLMKANGQEVETSSIRGTFNAVFSYPHEMTVKIKTDLDAADNTWRIIDCDGNVVKEFGPYPDGLVEEYTEQLSLEKGKIYGIEIFDCWGDGVRHPLGSFKLYDTDNNLIAQIKEINGYGIRQFFRADASVGVDAVESAADVVARQYIDLTGREVANPGAGVYILRTTWSDGKITTEKLIK